MEEKELKAKDIPMGKATLNKVGSYVISAQYKDVTTETDEQKLALIVEENKIESISISTQSGKN